MNLWDGAGGLHLARAGGAVTLPYPLAGDGGVVFAVRSGSRAEASSIVSRARYPARRAPERPAPPGGVGKQCGPPTLPAMP